MTERKLITSRGGLVLSALFFLCALVFFIFSLLPKGATAVVERDGKEIMRRELREVTVAETAEIHGENGITLEIAFYPDGARVQTSQCPDKICVNAGKLTRAGETAICLPAKVVLRLE